MVVPNAGGLGKNCVFDQSSSHRLRHFTAENLCLYATMVRIHDVALAEKCAVSSTTLVIVEVGRSQLQSS